MTDHAGSQISRPPITIEHILEALTLLRAWQQTTGPLLHDLLGFGGRAQAHHQEILEVLRRVQDRVTRTDERVGVVVEQLPYLATNAEVRALGARRPSKESVAVATLRAEVDTLRERLLRLEAAVVAAGPTGVARRLLGEALGLGTEERGPDAPAKGRAR